MPVARTAPIMIRHTPMAWITLLLVLTSGWASAGNGGTAVTPAELLFADGFQIPDTSFCSSLGLSSSNAAPANRVTILNLPTNLRIPEVMASRAGQFLGRLAIQQSDTGEVALIVPLLESSQNLLCA